MMSQFQDEKLAKLMQMCDVMQLVYWCKIKHIETENIQQHNAISNL